MTFAGIRRRRAQTHHPSPCHRLAQGLDRRKLARDRSGKMSALSSLYEFMTDQNAIATTPSKA